MALREHVPYAVAGVLATIVGMAAGHLTAALLDPASSPVLAVGSTVIDLTPTPVKEWAVREFGTADKPILIGSVFAGTILLAGAAGVLARRSFLVAGGILVALVALAGAMALTRPVAEPVDVVPALATGVVGLGALAWLVTTARTGRLGFLPGTDPDAAGSPGPAASRTGPAPSRRGFLVAGGVASVAAVALGTTGQWVIRMRTRIGDIVLPRAADPAPAFPTGLEETYPGITRFRTPNSRFYRVDTNLTLPVVTLDSWRLTIDGDVDEELTFSFDELLELPMIERDITLTCVSNEVGGTYVGGARWLGVRLTDLLDRAGVGSRADQLLSTAVDGFTISTPLAVATDGRDAMVAVGMNGEALPLAHGFPARLVTPGVYGFVGATKWLRRLTLTTYAAQEAYWTERDWATDAPVKIASRIDTPKPLARVAAGRTVIGGIAWAQTRGIAKVEVRIDGGAWQEARLGPSAGVDYWRQWYLPWDASPGQHMLAVRAVDGDGAVQTSARATPFPDGSSGLQEIVVIVA